MTRWQWVTIQLLHKLWLRAALIGVLGVASAILAFLLQGHIPWDVPGNIGSGAVETILTIIASSMLAVTTFSLSIMVSAYSAAGQSVTPRAAPLLMQDSVSQNVLSTFIGAFLFSIVGIVVLKTGAYDHKGREIMFGVTIFVIALIVVSLLRWIDHLTRFGTLGETTSRVEAEVKRSIEKRLAVPFLGGKMGQAAREMRDGDVAVKAEETGYIQHIDMSALDAICEARDMDMHVLLVPGAFAFPHADLVRINSDQHGDRLSDEDTEKIRKAFTIGEGRQFDQDLRFGLVVLSEVAARALSPATNDYGTAIDIIGRTVRLLSLWGAGERTGGEVQYPRIYVPALSTEDLFEDAFMLIARDGAGRVEIQLRLQKALRALAQDEDAVFRKAALTQAEIARARAEGALGDACDKARMRRSMGGC